MARWDNEDHLLSDDVIIVSKDDGTKTRRFTNSEEADAYYEYLKREEVQDSIAKNQAAAVAQNKEIIANQQRLIEAQERNNRMPQRLPFQPSRQILDPEYKEWLQFKKETDPEYQRWKRNKAAEEARKRQEEAARAAKFQAERDARERERQRQLQLEKERQERKTQEEIHPIEEDLINGKSVTDRVIVAMHTKNQQVIDILKVSSSQKILEALSRNPSIKVVDLNFVQKKLNDIKEKESRERAMEAERERRLREEQERKRREQAESEENFKSALKWIFGIIAVGVVIGLIVYFAKWIFAVIFVIALIVVFFSN